MYGPLGLLGGFYRPLRLHIGYIVAIYESQGYGRILVSSLDVSFCGRVVRMH